MTSVTGDPTEPWVCEFIFVRETSLVNTRRSIQHVPFIPSMWVLNFSKLIQRVRQAPHLNYQKCTVLAVKHLEPDYVWLNQLSNTTNLWWIDVYYIVINHMFRRLWPSSGWWVNKKHISSYIWHASLMYGGWGAGLLDGGTRSRVYWVWRGVYMGVYYANLSFLQFRAVIFGIHVRIHPPPYPIHTRSRTPIQ